jgi:hypothetical protein
MQTNEFTVAHRDDLYRLKAMQGLSRVEVLTKRLKYRNLMPHALKYAAWALAPGGTLLVRDDAPDSFDLLPRFVSFKLMRQWTYKLLAGEAQPVRLDVAKGEIELVRSRPPTPPGWGAGVVFSGRAEELPRLRACLDALLLQPELQPEKGGEILVCGPSGAEDCLAGYPQVGYLVHDMPAGPRVMICAKKNALIRQLKGPRIAIMHTRIKLEPDALRQVPAEFEIMTPRVLTEGRSGPEDYLSLGVHDAGLPGYTPRLAASSLRRVPAQHYLDLYDQGPPYVDGGVFFLRKDVHARCPLNEAVAWDEAEDLEWSLRAVADGLLLDLAPEARAYSSVGKLRSLPLPAAPARWLRDVRAGVLAARFRLQDRTERLLGRR